MIYIPESYPISTCEHNVNSYWVTSKSKYPKKQDPEKFLSDSPGQADHLARQVTLKPYLPNG